MGLNQSIDTLVEKCKHALVRLESIKQELDDGFLTPAQAKNQAQNVSSFLLARATDLQTAINALP